MAGKSQEEDWHEPYESRGSRTYLWGTGGEIPPVYPAVWRRRELDSGFKDKDEGDAKSFLLLLIPQTVKPSQIFFNHVGDG